MTESFPQRRPRFKSGDRVRTIGPTVGNRAQQRGRVIEVLGLNENAVFRYRVEFDNGACDSFFGFELELENAVD